MSVNRYGITYAGTFTQTSFKCIIFYLSHKVNKIEVFAFKQIKSAIFRIYTVSRKE